MIFHRRCLSAPPVTVLVGILFFILFLTKQFKDIYERNQKYYRMQGYSEFVDEVSQSMVLLEETANKSSESLHRLTAVLKQHNLLTQRLRPLHRSQRSNTAGRRLSR